MVVELISVGTELLLGNIVNTNANYLSRKCAELGLSLYYQVTVGDNESRLSEAIETALLRSDVIILTGGLGPTKDDLTKEVTAKVLSRNLVEDEHSRERMISYFKRSDFKNITDNNWKQTLTIENSTVVDNDNGTAPGYIVVTKDNKRIILLPGPPNEMIPMFRDSMFPYLRKLQPNVFFSEMVKICGIGESMVETKIFDLINNQSNPTIAPYAKGGEVHLRVTAAADSLEEASSMTEPIVKELKNRFQYHIYTTKEEETLEGVIVHLLKQYKLKLTCAESCTGGLLSGRIINVPGASDVFNEGFITYSNEAKSKYLGVNEATLLEYGAVSEQTAKEMVIGAATSTGSNAALAITGIAGPDGGTEEKPVGLVYIGCYLDGKVVVREYKIKGDRQKVRDYSVIYALDLLRRCILEDYKSKI